MEHYRKKNAGYTYRDSYAIDNDTGEVLKTQNMQIIEGSHVFSPMEWDRRKRLAEERTERERRIASSRPLGNFLMVSGRGFDELPPASLTRLIMLATYADYNNTLMAGRDKPMTRSEAQKILGLTAHVIRHTYATTAAEQGIDPKSLQGLMGHKRVEVTMGIYAETRQKRMAAAGMQLSGMYERTASN